MIGANTAHITIMENHILSCDWGTSSFRLRLVDLHDDNIIAEQASAQGVAVTFDEWENKGRATAKDIFFRQQLKKEIETLAQKVQVDLAGIVTIVSGMASSSIGMHELPYAALPFALSGSDAIVQTWNPSEEFPHKLLLISGVRSGQNAMRGEETQLIGLSELVELPQNANEAIFIFPGTHSKHIYVRSSQLINVATYMTGELFHLMATQSILKDSVELSSLSDEIENNKEAFLLGVREAGTEGIMKSLFTVRTNQLFNRLDKKENTHYLSGLLIGAELNHLAGEKNSTLVLCSGYNLNSFYTLALEELGLSSRTITVPAPLIEKASIMGQIKIYKHNSIQ